jgi:hypothetical protein
MADEMKYFDDGSLYKPEKGKQIPTPPEKKVRSFIPSELPPKLSYSTLVKSPLRRISPACYKGSKTYKKYLPKGKRRSRSRKTGSPRAVKMGPRGGRYHLMRCSKKKIYSSPSKNFMDAIRKRSQERRIRSP